MSQPPLKMPHVAIEISPGSGGYARSILQGIYEYGRVHQNFVLVRAGDPFREGNERAWTAEEKRQMRRRQFDGLIGFIGVKAFAEALREARVPVVNVSNRSSEVLLPLVRADDEAMGRMAAAHFLRHKFRHFGFFGIEDHRYSFLRSQGFTEELRAAGHACSVCHFSPASPRLIAWLRQLPKPVAILCCNDQRAAHLLDVCKNHTLDVPNEIAVMGVDNSELDGLFPHVPLSTVELDGAEVGRMAIARLLQLLQGEEIPEETLVPPLAVIHRKSTDLFAVKDPAIGRALAFMREHMTDGIHVADLLKLTHMSRRAFERRFHEEMGHAPYEELLRMRLHRAEELLTSTSLNVTEIAASSGFHLQKFSKIFRERFGMTPRKFRQAHAAPSAISGPRRK